MGSCVRLCLVVCREQALGWVNKERVVLFWVDYYFGFVLDMWYSRLVVMRMSVCV